MTSDTLATDFFFSPLALLRCISAHLLAISPFGQQSAGAVELYLCLSKGWISIQLSYGSMDADECFMSSLMWLRDPLICSREYGGAVRESICLPGYVWRLLKP